VKKHQPQALISLDAYVPEWLTKRLGLRIPEDWAWSCMIGRSAWPALPVSITGVPMSPPPRSISWRRSSRTDDARSGPRSSAGILIAHLLDDDVLVVVSCVATRSTAAARHRDAGDGYRQSRPCAPSNHARPGHVFGMRSPRRFVSHSGT